MKSGLLALVASVVVGAAGACSSTAAGTDASADAQTSPDLAADAPPEVAADHPSFDGDPCTMPLADVASDCPASYDLIDSFACRDCVNNPSLCSYSTASCGNFLTFLNHVNLSTTLCYYDVTSRALVALIFLTDYNGFCGGSSFGYSAGVPTGACEQHPPFTVLKTPYVCPYDGGAGDGGGLTRLPDASDASGG